MTILFPSFYNSGNTYVKDIVDGLQAKAELVVETQNFWTSNLHYDVVHIQWPEELFNWREVNDEDISLLKKRIQYFKEKNTKIVATLHNSLPHRNHHNDRALYETVYKNADAIVHLGKYSFSLYPEANNYCIPHPNYNSQISVTPKEAHKNIRFLSFGNIRKEEEEQQIIDAFLLLDNPNTELVITNSIAGKPKKFLKREILKKHAYNKRQKFLASKNISLIPKRLSQAEVNDYFNQADIIISPRIDSLNSGVIFMGFSFGKTVIGPNIGNMKEILEMNNNPTFTPRDINSIAQAMKKAVASFTETGQLNKAYSDTELSAEKIAEKHYELYKRLITA